ncbi:hypothetical protein [Archangium sp. Cb G35]|uniref:hypothetical protein n=1 Tax=Archangium sp. Cb G35 TaxID=1920190 RepID=UPI0011614321|nr:hypothetical protein [Archangium sp. Cb G35]
MTDTRAGYLFNLSDSLHIVEEKYGNLLVPVTDGAMIVASDYSGQHKEASHEAYSFLVTTDQALDAWLPSLRAFRQRWLPDSRRISFKKLNEPVRWRALPAFLETVGNLSGNLITILIDRRVGSFMAGGPDATVDAFPDCFSAHANRGTVEKMFRLASFVALILSGLRREDQVSNWISDHDEALDTHDKREQFARLATYLTFGLTGWRKPADHWFGTTESPMAPYWSEDVAAVPDLVAGAYCQMSGFLPAFLGMKTWQVRMAPSSVEDRRAHAIGDWLANGRATLRHVLLRLEQDGNGEVRSSAQAFMGST